MIQNKLPPLILVLRELKTSLYNFLISLQLSISPNEGILSLANRAIELINKEDIANNLNDKDLITYQTLINDLSNKKNNLIDVLNNESVVVNQNSDLSTLINHCLSIIPQKNTYFITSKKNLILNLSGNGYVYFKDNNRNIIKEVLLKNNDITEIKIEGLTKEKNTIFLENLEHVSELDVHGNEIEEINFGINSTITTLKLYENKIQNLDITNLLSLQYFHIYTNPIVDNCLNTGFKEERDELGFPIVNTNSESYQKLSALLNSLPNRAGQALGSIVLYPWYGLETLIYEADGNHYRTPYLEIEQDGKIVNRTGYDFNGIDENGNPKFTTSLEEDTQTKAEPLPKGTICKYPRRLRFISPNGVESNYKENESEIDINQSNRTTPGEWFTDQPLSDVIYNSSDQEDTTRSLKFINNNKGIEYENENEEFSILYAMIKGYDINDATKNSDVSQQKLYYCTFDKQLNKIEHHLTKYNELRKNLEKEISQNGKNFKNWFFGSAIQNTEDFNCCGYYFKFHGAHHVWESTQKGFGRVYGIWDYIGGNQPDWNKKNIIRFTHKYGNVADAFFYNIYTNNHTFNRKHLEKVYRTDARIKNLNMANNSFEETSVQSFGHGDHIVSYLLSQGENNTIFNNQEINFKLFGMCPNAMAYILDHLRGMLIIQKKLNNSITVTNNNSVSDNYMTRLSIKELYKYSDSVSVSLSFSTTEMNTNQYFNYLNGRFGERRYLVQSSGNNGDGSEAITDLYDGYLPFGKYGTFYNQSNLIYHPTSFHASALNPGNTSACFANSSTAIKDLETSFSDYITGIGVACDGYNIEYGIMNYKQGTSMSAPISAGSLLLMMNLYKIVYPDYLDEPRYINNDNSLTENLIFDENGLLNGGYGKFSKFMNYIKNNWCNRPKDQMTHQQGIGAPTFTTTPNPIEIHQKYNYIQEFNNAEIGKLYNPINSKQEVYYKILKQMNLSQGTLNPSFDFNCAVVHYDENGKYINGSKIMPLKEGTYNFVLCDTISSFGDKVNIKVEENQKQWNRPDEYNKYYNTYYFYPQVTFNVNNNNLLNPISSQKIDKKFITIQNEQYISLSENCHSKSFTIQMKINFDFTLFSDVLIPNDNTNEYIFNPIIINIDGEQFKNQIYFDRLLINPITKQINFSKEITKETSIRGRILQKETLLYKIIRDKNNVFNTIIEENEDFDLRRCQLNWIFDLKNNEDYIFSFVFEKDIYHIYINGTKIASYRTIEANLKNTTIYGNLLTPTGLEHLRHNIDKNLLIYDRALNDYEIAYNSAYLLQQKNEEVS